MRLIACHIDGFGKYKGVRFDFDRGLTCFCRENGEGKTTLAAFLRAMLYGMDTDRGSSFGDRSLYVPFEGGAYGGWLTLEWQGSVYKIVRSFDKKSATKDTLAVLDGQERPTDALGDKIGEALFGLSREAFVRTSFITWQKIDIGLGEGIGERLGGAVRNASAVTLEKALENIDKKSKEYHSERKSGGVYTGKIPRKEEEILALEAEILRAEQAEKRLSEMEAVHAELWRGNADLKAEIEKMRAAGTRRSRWEHYQSLLADAEEQGARAREIAGRYPQGFPTEEELSLFGVRQKNVSNARVRLEGRVFPKQRELEEAERRFAGGVPTEQQLAQTEGLIDEYLLARMKQRTAEPVPVYAPSPAANKKKKQCLAVLVASLLLLAAGAVLITLSTAAAIACWAVGVIGALSAALLFHKANKLAAQPTMVAAPVADTEATESVRIRLSGFFAGYGIVTSDFTDAMKQLRAALAVLRCLRAEKEEYEAETERLRLQSEEEAEALRAVLVRYSLTENGWMNAATDARTHAEAARMAAAKAEEAERYRAQYGLGEEEPPAADGLEQLLQRQQQAQDELNDLKGEIARLHKLADPLAERKNELARLREEAEELKRERELYVLAYKMLQKADETLKATYLVPMQGSFVKYGRLLGLEWVDGVKLGDGLEVRCEMQGDYRREEHFSDGQRALSALCLRLALMENLHKGERPFCILDDPFVHLDEKHLAEVKPALQRLAEEMQIIYFTCHPSRAL